MQRIHECSVAFCRTVLLFVRAVGGGVGRYSMIILSVFWSSMLTAAVSYFVFLSSS